LQLEFLYGANESTNGAAPTGKPDRRRAGAPGT